MWMGMQMMMWGLGIQTTIIISIMAAMYTNLSKKIDRLSERIDSLDKRVFCLEVKFEDFEKRLFRMEGILQTHGHCLFSQCKAENKTTA